MTFLLFYFKFSINVYTTFITDNILNKKAINLIITYKSPSNVYLQVHNSCSVGGLNIPELSAYKLLNTKLSDAHTDRHIKLKLYFCSCISFPFQ